MNAVNDNIKPEVSDMLNATFQKQRKEFLSKSSPDYKQRIDDLKSLKRMLTENKEDVIDALNQDYGNRSRFDSLFAEFIASLDGIDDAIKHLKKWMKVEKRHIDRMMYPGAKNRVIPQPLGVVGMIVPWNFPINLSFAPLTGAFAAGNTAMVKMSENSIALSRLLIKVSGKYFPETKLAFFEETGGVGVEFSQIPFDKMVFTGSGPTGRKVMESAAKNLTPVILELGGKAPAVVDPNFPVDKAVERIMFVKQFNAGQICTNVDYVFVHETQKESFIHSAKAWANTHVPDINSTDFTSIIDDASVVRLQNTVEDARAKGATVINLNGQEVNVEKRKFPLTIVTDTTEDMFISSRETFGPILMIKTYRDADEVIQYINDRDRPLAFYPFTNDKKLADLYIDRVMSGGVSVNDALLHVAQHDLPFGGVGPSGMGHYHGRDGFISFSKMRPVFYQAGFTAIRYLAPPYSKFTMALLEFLAKLKSR
jgi:coniferyl-aldehyde dehydrogenase